MQSSQHRAPRAGAAAALLALLLAPLASATSSSSSPSSLAAATAPACPSPLLAWAPGFSSVNASVAPDNKFGLEDGIVVRRADGGFSMVAAAMYGDPVWVRMRLDIYRSEDALAWRRVRSVRVSDANFDGSSLHSSSWGPFFVHDAANDTWALSYVGYRGQPANASGWLSNYEGTIFARYANESGDAGLDGDFRDAGAFAASGDGGDVVLLAPDDFSVPGPWPHPCQGLQGTDSMYPYQLDDGSWAALVGTSHQETPDPWPQPGGGKWPVSLATAPALAGSWTRRNPAAGGAPADAPCVDLHSGYSENPIVSRRADNASAFQVVHDVINAEARGFGYGCSDDGLNWPQTTVVPLPFGCRTPFGLVPMTAAEVAARTADILAYGVLNATQIGQPNSSLSWLFYTSCPPPGGDYCIGNANGGFEEFYAAIVWLPML
jgi:hypothetical protein